MFLKRKKNVEENIDSEPIVNEDEVSASKLLHGDDDEAEAVPGSDFDEADAYIGSMMISSIMEKMKVDRDEAIRFLLGSMSSDYSSDELISARAARELEKLVGSGELSEDDVEEMLKNPDFTSMLYEMPISGAIRVHKAESSATKAQKDLENARLSGEADVLEKLKARRALPQSTRDTVPVSPEIDYSHMSSKEFNELRKKLLRAVSDGKRIKL